MSMSHDSLIMSHDSLIMSRDPLIMSHDPLIMSHDPLIMSCDGPSFRLLGSYERMEAPSLRRVDANGSKEEVLTAVLKVIQDRLSTTVSAPSP